MLNESTIVNDILSSAGTHSSPTIRDSLIYNDEEDAYPSSVRNRNYNVSDILKNIKIQNVNRLVIAQLNINSLKRKFDTLKEVIQENIDVLVITESKLDDSFPTAQFTIEGFSPPYRNDLNKHAGGVMIYVREDLACKELQIIKNSGEGIFLELNLRKVKWLLFGGYNHKKTNIKNFLKEVGPLLDYYMS